MFKVELTGRPAGVVPAAALAILLAMAALAEPASAQQASPAATANEGAELAQEAFTYLYPLVLMDLTRKQLTNMPPGSELGGPMNAFTNVRAFPTADMKAVVRPNFDTLYSSSWLDLTNGPMVVSHEDTDGRYFLLPMLDMWTDVFAVPGKRTDGTAAAAYAVVPPGWNGEVPSGIKRIDAPTPYVWVIGRTQTNGPADYANVHKVQDGFRVQPLADWGKPPVEPRQVIDASVDTRTEPPKQVEAMSGTQFFTYAAELMKVNPPHATDWSTLARIAGMGLEPGKDFDASKASPGVLDKGKQAALEQMASSASGIAPVVDGWVMDISTMGVYGNNYLKRAIIALGGLGANQPEDAIYPLNVSDANGDKITGDKAYVLHFDKHKIPPVNAFWSLTMYDARGYQVANPLNRFALGDRSELKANADGSIDIYIQHESPGADKEANWLPGPEGGELGLTLRLYEPKPEVLAGNWKPPAIRQQD